MRTSTQTSTRIQDASYVLINPATSEKQDELAMIFQDSVLIDSFGRLRVSTANTLFDSQQEY